MANGYSRLPRGMQTSQNRHNRSQSTVLLPTSSPPKQRASSYYPTQAFDESNPNPDPFYLEHSLAGHSWGPGRPGLRDAHQYFVLPAVSHSKSRPSSAVRDETIRSRPNVNRSTLSVVELEHQLGLQQTGALRHSRGTQPIIHQSQGSFSSVQTEATPELTPSSSFSSNYSTSLHQEPLVQMPKGTSSNPASSAFYMPASSLRNRCQPPAPIVPRTPTRDVRTPLPSSGSSDTLIMSQPECQDLASLRGKPLPSLPPFANAPASGRNANAVGPKKPQTPSGRPSIEPSMISPPSLINPVTMEPHTTHFDQALFIPANDCPSPVPSPVPGSPAIERQITATSGRHRPSTSFSEAHRCEQSVWESDSENESLDPRSLSRKPIDTLKKVRSRVQLRVAKSTPKLQNNHHNRNQQHQPPPSQGSGLEKFPSMPDHPSDAMVTQPGRPDRDPLRPAAHQTLRLVAPSTSSLVHHNHHHPQPPRSRHNTNPHPNEPRHNVDIDRSTAAAIQAKSRRRQRSDSPDPSSRRTDRDKLCSFCREERSDKAIHHTLTLARPPLYKRVWDSLRVLGCHADITTTRPRKPM
ncbi:uncharacterized protein BDW47DRAFT_70882 [Aspergillus candidus]|uniref:Uncharacterized protein n=1 Tax=Aspergillus candidus TaxID=41067 RepID=A0A2I2F2K5_ASPCN|nr:hypothetical protein BDW47DRAFT_70882 [Aspergillus candidus]PLB34872.1 hypothetical protein BDW47DRAFT_70882 [Aspergillus candidus]